MQAAYLEEELQAGRPGQQAHVDEIRSPQGIRAGLLAALLLLVRCLVPQQPLLQLLTRHGLSSEQPSQCHASSIVTHNHPPTVLVHS